MKLSFIFFISLFNIIVQAQTITHDNLNRITSITYTDSTQVVYSYDAVGNRITETITKPNNNSLPIKLASFEVIESDCQTTLKWTTSSQINVSHFEIEQTTSISNFKTIQSIEAAQNSTTIEAYSWVHTDPMKGVNYYRLKTIDLDGSVSYSNTKAINFNTCFEEEIKLYPNPSKKGVITLEINSVATVDHIEVYDATGKLLQIPIQHNNSRHWVLDTKNLSAGSYTAQIVFKGNTRPTSSQQFIIGE